jgi:hypothetical protein
MATLHPEFAVDDSDEVDDSERAEYVAEAKELWANLKTGASYLASVNGVPDNFLSEFLTEVPQVQGARMITSAPGETKRQRFDSIVVALGDNEWNVKTLTEVAQTISKQGGDNKGTTQSEVYAKFLEDGGGDATAGEPFEFTFKDFTITAVKTAPAAKE